jgi:hypothetical protein
MAQAEVPIATEILYEYGCRDRYEVKRDLLRCHIGPKT